MPESLCVICGIFPQSKRPKVAKGQCCNKCPNHGPWCTSFETNCPARTVALDAVSVSVQSEPVDRKASSVADATVHKKNGKSRRLVVEVPRTSAASVEPVVPKASSESIAVPASVLSPGEEKHIATNQSQHRGRLIKSLLANPQSLEGAPEELQDDCHVVLAAMQHDPSSLLHASPRLQADSKFMLQAVKQDGLALKFATQEQRLNMPIVLAALRQNISALEHVPDDLLNDRSFLLEALKVNSSVLSKVPEYLREDEEFMVSVVTRNPLALQHAGNQLRRNQDVVLSAIKANPIAITCVADELANDHEFMLRAFRADTKVLRYVPELCRDEEFMLAVISHSPSACMYLSQVMFNDHDFVIKLLLQTPGSGDLVARWLPANLTESLDFVSKGVCQDGLLLRYASRNLRDNMDVVLMAVKQNGMALEHVGTRLRANRLVILEALTRDFNALRFVPKCSVLANLPIESVPKALKKARRHEWLRRLSNLSAEVWQQILRHSTAVELFECASVSKMMRQEVNLLAPFSLQSFVYRHGMITRSPDQRLPSMTAQRVLLVGRNLGAFLNSPMMASNIRFVNLGFAPVGIVSIVAHRLPNLPKLEEVVYPAYGWGSTYDLKRFEKTLHDLIPDVRLVKMERNFLSTELSSSVAWSMWQDPWTGRL